MLGFVVICGGAGLRVCGFPVEGWVGCLVGSEAWLALWCLCCVLFLCCIVWWFTRLFRSVCVDLVLFILALRL